MNLDFNVANSNLNNAANKLKVYSVYETGTSYFPHASFTGIYLRAAAARYRLTTFEYKIAS